MNAVRWRPKALEELARIVRRISEENPVAARQVGRELLLAGDSLSLFPYRGRVGRMPGTRDWSAITHTSWSIGLPRTARSSSARSGTAFKTADALAGWRFRAMQNDSVLQVSTSID